MKAKQTPAPETVSAERDRLPLAAFLLLATALAGSAASVRLDELDLGAMTAGWGRARANLAVTGVPLKIGGVEFVHGVGTHAVSECPVLLDGRAVRFTARVGVDDNAKNSRASVEFVVYGDDREMWRSGPCRWHEAPRNVTMSLSGVKNLSLFVEDAGNGNDFDHADWADAVFEFDGDRPRVAAAPVPAEDFVLLTPPAPAEPRLNGPLVTAARPGAPFLYRIPCTGERPFEFHATGLPPGLALHAASGIITGRVARAGSHQVLLSARNSRGRAERPLRIEIGSTLALTPPMGWNSWYIHYNRVTEATMRQAGEQMIASGMADYGYQYVNIDDCWMVLPGSTNPELGGPAREADGRLRPNGRFPDIRGMVNDIHARGLKAGIYISPGPRTCAGFEGSWQHEARDARTFAEWGFDFLKYDWCSYGEKAGGDTREHLVKPYRIMWSELQKQERDIVFNLCQYGMGEVWRWAADVGHCWRTTGDLGLERGARLPGFYRIAFSNAAHSEFARPGAWNDPDYLLIGWVGDAHGMGAGQKTTLTPAEQYSYMSLWSLMAAPLIFSGDMAKLDPFTLNVLCNHEVIAVDQDPLGKQARIVRQSDREFILIKELQDGSRALGLFNLGRAPATISVSWPELGLSGVQRVRDVWRQRPIGEADQRWSAEVPRHGVMLVRLETPAAQNGARTSNPQRGVGPGRVD